MPLQFSPRILPVLGSALTPNPVFGGRRKRRVALNPKVPLGVWPVSGGRKNRVALNPKVPLCVGGGMASLRWTQNVGFPHILRSPCGGGYGQFSEDAENGGLP